MLAASALVLVISFALYQVTKMIAAEAVTYALYGGVIGIAAISQMLFKLLIEGRFAYAVCIKFAPSLVFF